MSGVWRPPLPQPSTTHFEKNGQPTPGKAQWLQAVDAMLGAMGVQIADGQIISNISGGQALPSGNTLSAILDEIVGSARGTILVRAAAAWGALALGTNGQILESNGTDLVFVTPSQRTLLNTITLSSAGSGSDTTSFSSTYPVFEIELEAIVPSVNASGLLLTMHSGGSFQSTNYTYGHMWEDAGGGPNRTYNTAQAQIILDPNNNRQSNTASNGGYNGNFIIRNPLSTVAPKPVYGDWEFNGTSQGWQFGKMLGVWTGGNGAVDGFKVAPTSGTISGIIRVYGRP